MQQLQQMHFASCIIETLHTATIDIDNYPLLTSFMFLMLTAVFTHADGNRVSMA